MTVTDQIKVLDDKIISNQVQYVLGREVAKMSALSCKDLLEKYEYLAGEDLGHKPSVFEKAKCEYSPSGNLINNAKSKTNKVYSKNKQDKYLANSHHTFAKFKNINEFKELSLASMHKRLNGFHKRFNKLKIVTPQADNNQVLNEKVFNNFGDIFNELYYICKDRYNEKKDRLNTQDKKKFTTKN